MHSRTLLTIGLFLARSLAQDSTTTARTSAASITGGILCDDYATHCAFATSVTSTATSTSSMTTTLHYTVINATSLLSNLSTIMVTVSTSTTSFMNTSMTTSATSRAVPTSILVATGTPVVPSGFSTITSITIITPGASGTAATSPTTQSGGVRKAVGISSVALVVLGISSLLLA